MPDSKGPQGAPNARKPQTSPSQGAAHVQKAVGAVQRKAAPGQGAAPRAPHVQVALSRSAQPKMPEGSSPGPASAPHVAAALGAAQAKPEPGSGVLQEARSRRRKKGGAPKPAKVAAWEKTWRNIRCYAGDTAQSMSKRMTMSEIQLYLTAFGSYYKSGVRGHCSQTGSSTATASTQTVNDLKVFHSWHRSHRPW